RSKDDRRVELFGRRLVRAPRPLHAERTREGLALLVPGTREREEAPPFVPSDLRDDVSRGAEAVEAERLRVAGKAKRAIADQPGAKERRCFPVGVLRRQLQAEA